MRRITATLLPLLWIIPACSKDGDGDGSPFEPDAAGERNSLAVVNDSDHVIEDFYIAAVGSSDWGPDLLGADALFPDEEFLIVDIECDFYDVRLIDDTGGECLILDIDLC